MKKAHCVALLSVIALCAGCGSKADSLLKRQIKSMNKFADAIESGASGEEIAKLQKELETTGKELDALNLSDDEKKALMEKYKDDVEAAAKRIQKAMVSRMSSELGKGLGEMFKNMPKSPMNMPKPPTP